jgi:hypothetical protein
MNTYRLIQDLNFRIRAYNSDLEHYNKMALMHKEINKVETALYTIKIERDTRNLQKVEKCLSLISSLENTFLSQKDIEEVTDKFKEV